MSQKRKASVEKFVVAAEKPRTGAIAAGSFLAGAFAMWLALYFFAPTPRQPSTPSPADAPDVSRMPPAQAAATLGNFEYDRANWTAAVRHYESAIAAGLDTADVRTDLGTAYRHLGAADRALAEYGIAQRKDPFHQNSLFNQAVVYAEMLHDRPRALAAAREYVRRFPQGRGLAAARKLVAELEGSEADVETKLSEFLQSPQPARAVR